MSLTYKDAVATVITAGVVVLSYAKLKEYDWPLLGSWRLATLALLILGLGTCIFVGSNITAIKGGWMNAGAAVGGLAMALAILGLIFNNKIMFILLSVSIIALWALTTIHHIVERGA